MAAKKPSKNVSTSSKLSEGTMKVISELTSSANLTPFQKRQLFSAVSAGNPLPLDLPAHHPSTLKRKRQERRVAPPAHSRRKTKEAIVQEGAYERPSYQPPPEQIRSYEESKFKLQHAMESAESSLPSEAQQVFRANISPSQTPPRAPVANTLVDQRALLSCCFL